jgi:hypothetical protein
MKTIRNALTACIICATAAQGAVAQTYYARARLDPLPKAANGSPNAPQTPADGADGPQWSPGAWSSWSSTCSPTATHTRTVQCKDGDAVVADSMCTGTRPEASGTEEVYSGCGNMVKNGSFDQGIDHWSGLTARMNYTNLGNSGLIPVGGTATTVTYPLEAGRSYALATACEASGGWAYWCYLKITVTVNGAQVASGSFAGDARAGSPRSFGSFTSGGGPATLTIQNTGQRPMFVDLISIKPQ